jgi:hypothetical protein
MRHRPFGLFSAFLGQAVLDVIVRPLELHEPHVVKESAGIEDFSNLKCIVINFHRDHPSRSKIPERGNSM